MPSIDEIKSALKDAGHDEEDIAERVEDLQSSYKMMRDNERLAYMKVAKDLNVEVESFPEVTASSSSGDKRVKVKDIGTESCPDYFSVEGHVLDVWDDVTRNNSKAKKFHFVDETGIITGAVYQEEYIEEFEQSNIDPFDRVVFSGASYFNYEFDGNSGTILTVTYADVNLPEEDKSLDEEIKNVHTDALMDSEPGYLEGMIVDEQIREFKSCVECGSKIDPESGQCPDCGTIEYEEKSFQTLMISRGSSNFRVEMAPNVAPGTSMDGKMVKVAGRWNKSDGKLEVLVYRELEDGDMDIQSTSEESEESEDELDTSELEERHQQIQLTSGELGEKEIKLVQAVYHIDGPTNIEGIAEYLGTSTPLVENEVNMLNNAGVLYSPQIGKVDTDKEILEEVGVDTSVDPRDSLDTSTEGSEDESDDTTDEEDEDHEEDEDDEEEDEGFECRAENCNRVLKSKSGRTRHEKASHPELFNEEDDEEQEETEESSQTLSEDDREAESDSESDSTPDEDEVLEVADSVASWLKHYDDLPESTVEVKISKETEYVDEVKDELKSREEIDVEDKRWNYGG